MIVAPLLAALTPGGMAGADSISSVRDHMEAIEHQVIADAAQIHALARSYAQEVSGERTLAQAIASQQVRIDALSETVAARRAALRGELVLGYMGEYTGVPDGNISGTGVDDPAVRLAYISIATGTLRDTLDSYTASRAALAGAKARLLSALAARQAAAARAAAVRRAALADVAAAQGRLDQLQTQLIALQRQAITSSGTTGLAGQTQGLPVGGGLLEVVTSELSGSAPPAPDGAPTTTSTVPETTTTNPTATTVGRSGSPSTTVADHATTTTVRRSGPATTTPASTTTTLVRSTTTSGPPLTVVVTGSGGAPGVWLELRLCESGDNYAENTGNGYYGAYQFSQQTWTYLGYPGRPDLESPAMQDQAARELQARAGWGQWPACSAALGL